MRLIFLAIMILLAAAINMAQAQTMIDSGMANAYYESCIGEENPRLTPKTKIEYCSCKSSMLMEQMSVEDMAFLQENSTAGQTVRHHMHIYVDSPCMQYPAQHIVAAECMEDPKIDMMKLRSERAALCGCMGIKTGEWLNTAGMDLMKAAIKGNPHTNDPLGSVMELPEFKRGSYEALVTCMEESQ